MLLPVFRQFSTVRGHDPGFEHIHLFRLWKTGRNFTGTFPPSFPEKHPEFSTALRSFHTALAGPPGIHRVFHRSATECKPRKTA